MSVWLTSVLPVGTLVVGAALTMAGQALSDRRTRFRERQAREDAFRIESFKLERETLIALQDQLDELYREFVTVMFVRESAQRGTSSESQEAAF